MWGSLPAGDPCLQFASFWANSFTAMVAGAVLALVGLSRFFPKRRGYAVFVGYFALKALVNAGFDAVYLMGWDGDALQAVNALWVSATAVLSYLVIYYTWNASLLKVGIAATFVDIVAGVSCEVAVVVARWIAGMPLNGDFYGPFGWQSVFIAVFSLVVGVVALRLLGPFARWLRMYEFRHRRFWQCLIIVLIAVLASSRFFTPQVATERNVMAVMFVAVPLFACVMAFSVHQMRAARDRRDHLAKGRGLLAAYTQAVRAQSADLEDNRSELDVLAGELERLQDMHTRGRLEDHLRDLRSACDSLRYGVYSDCPALDAVVAAYVGRFADERLGLDVRIAPLGERNAYLAPFAHMLLDWAYRLCVDQGNRRVIAAALPDEQVSFRVARRGNVDILRLDLACRRGVHFPRYLLQDVDSGVRSTVVERRDGARKIVLVMLEGGAGAGDAGGKTVIADAEGRKAGAA